MEMPFQPNEGKQLVIETADYGRLARYPVRTHVITKDDVLEDVLDKYVKEYVQAGDTIIMSEKIVAISQGRAFPISAFSVEIRCQDELRHRPWNARNNGALYPRGGQG